MDQWPQYLHGADNNAVSQDLLVGPPRRLQWVGTPDWSRSHMGIATVNTVVTAGGRLFTIEDTASPENPFLPGRFALVARDAFNGVVLWQRPIPRWEPVTRYIKDISTQLQRRLVAVGDTVYVTLGLDAPIVALDAKTGRLLRTFDGTQRTQEFSIDEGVLHAVVGDRMNSASYDVVKHQGATLPGSDPQAPFSGTGFRGAYAPEVPDQEHPVCDITACQLDTGRVLWQVKDVTDYVACSLAVRGPVAVWQTKHGLTCVDRASGQRKWHIEKNIALTNNPSRAQILSKLDRGIVLGGDAIMPNPVVLADDAVYAKEGQTLVARSLQDGAELWTAPIADNYHKSADLFVAAGRVWTGGSAKPTAYDPKSGEQQMVITQQMTGPMGHDRCYRNFITDRFYINSKTGGADFVDLRTGDEYPNHWLRGTCGMGVIPANGLLYVPPYSCQCSAGAMIQGMNALAGLPELTSPDQEIPVKRELRLIRGPAFGESEPGQVAGPADWPTYRHDGTRGGATPAGISARLEPAWQTPVGTRLSPPVVAGGRLFVADIDAHRLVALDARAGQVLWEYLAGGRIDSPPTCHEGTVLFGSRDGWVHCLRAADGALVWRFRDLPERLIGAHGQLESAWPVCGSVLVSDDTAYFAAGRSSFLDGGIFVYALDAKTGELKHHRRIQGPFDPGTGFPSTDKGPAGPFKADILVQAVDQLYVRHRGFTAELDDIANAQPHVMASAGFLSDQPQHRTYWTVGTNYAFTTLPPPSGDILVWDGERFFEVSGFPVGRHSYFDPRVQGYRLLAGQLAEEQPQQKKRRATAPRAKVLWTVDIPLTGHAMAKAGDVVFVAGTPAFFPPEHDAESYEAAYGGQRGGILWAAAAADGSKLAEYPLDAAPCWDAMAVAEGRLYLATRDGRVLCFVETLTPETIDTASGRPARR
jgi:outer membrane protein assembly factor BamB